MSIEQHLEQLIRRVVREELEAIASRLSPPQSEPGYLSPTEAAEYLSVSSKSILRWIGKGLLPAKKLGRVYRIKRSVLDTFELGEDPEDTIRVAAAVSKLL